LANLPGTIQFWPRFHFRHVWFQFLTMWVQFWQCGSILTVWFYFDGVILFWQCDSILTVWFNFDSVIQFWQCDFNFCHMWFQFLSYVISIFVICDFNVCHMWFHFLTMWVQFWQCDLILTVWFNFYSVIQFRQCCFTHLFL
jgi:hypothetical protein